MNAGGVVAAVMAVLLLALATWRIRQGRPRRALLGVSLAVLLAVYAAGALPDLPDGENAVEDAGDALGAWAYPLAAAVAFLETSIPPVTLVFPGEWVLLFLGAVASQGDMEIIPLLAIAWVFSMLGDSVCFLEGRLFGRSFLIRFGGPIGLSKERIERVDSFFDRWGAPTVAFGRLLPLARPFGPFVAGAARFPYRRFLMWNVLGTLLFSLAFCLAGYYSSRSYEAVAKSVGRIGFGALALVLAIGVAVWLVRRRRRRAAAGVAEPASAD
jgi:membrane-associated protein